MELTLMIKGSASHLAMILASLPDGVTASAPSVPSPVPAPVGAPAPVPAPLPMPAAPSGGDGDDADDTTGGATDGTGFDADGLPWDERIHASTKTKTAKGTWTKVRNGPKGDALAAIEAELRARAVPPVAMPMPAVAPVAQPVPPMPAPAVEPAAQPAPMPIPAMPVPAAPLPPVAAPMPVAAPAATEQPAVAAAPVYSPLPAAVEAAVAQATGTLDFAQFMQHLSGKMTERDATGAPLVHADYLAGITAEISTAFAPHGIPPLTAITDIASNPQMITYAVQLLQRDGRW